jgi:glycosyltransferase involved in cell wall biosynthesis
MGGRGIAVVEGLLASLAPDAFAFCISETVKSEFLSVKKLPPEHVFVTPLAASRAIFHPVADRAAVEAVLTNYRIPVAPYFLTLSSFDPRKNFEHVIRSFADAVRNGHLPASNLLIVGSNPERNPQVNRAIAELPSLASRIITPGFIPDADLAAIYSGALAFLFPSLSEGFGIPVLEAMQCGVPVVCSDAPALPEVAGDAAILLDPRDLPAWSEALVRLNTDGALRTDLAARSLRRAAEFSWDRFTRAVLDGYRESLSTT